MVNILKMKDIREQNICDNLDLPFEYELSFVKSEDEIGSEITYLYDDESALDFVNQQKPARMIWRCEPQRDFKYLCDIFSSVAVSIRLIFKKKKYYRLVYLESLTELEAISIYPNNNINMLWNTSKNSKLKSFEVIGCNALYDFACLENNKVEKIRLLSKHPGAVSYGGLHVADFTFINRCEHLKWLDIDIVKDRLGEFYLKTLARTHTLEYLYCERSFFTFKQFAWLATKLPDLKEGLEPYKYIEEQESYRVIGRNMPYSILGDYFLNKYQKLYESYKERYKNDSMTPYDWDLR